MKLFPEIVKGRAMSCWTCLGASICLGLGILTTLAADAESAAPLERTDGPDVGSERARQVLENFPSRGQRYEAAVKPRSPQATLESFKLKEGLEAEVVLHEPIVTQPLFLNFDERGRLWVVQYAQYPYPAGLKIMDLGDQFHATYDKVPPAPPNQDRGADKITIHEDTNGDGIYDRHKVFLEGLNMVSAMERGRGGVWVLNPPYLLFYPDLDNDDIPDGDPVVHLAGFGLEDTHSVASSLRWGPDGWLWGAQGSGVTADIRRPGVDGPEDSFPFKGQAIWRYHPERRVFELFAEGGGNTFSLVMDSQGRVFSGTNGGGVRGLHYAQGAFYSKNFGEHGYLTNPYAFGYFGAMPHDWSSPRFSQTLIFYEEGQLGPDYQDHFIAPNALRNRVDLTRRLALGSTYQTKDVGTVLESTDRWFRPVDTKVGPDGAVYIADWYDIRLTHMDPRNNWDRERGRVYRIKAKDSAPAVPFDLSRKTSRELVGLLEHDQPWFRKTALRLLMDRRDASIVPSLKAMALDSAHAHALEALWAWHGIGPLTAEDYGKLMAHAQAPVRMWGVRLFADRPRPVPPELANLMVDRVALEPDAQVRSQWASSLRRMPGPIALKLWRVLVNRPVDIEDPHIPLLLWWALECFVESDRAAVVALFQDPSLWDAPMVHKHIAHRLARRYATFLSPENQLSLTALARAATPPGMARLRDGVTEAFRGRGIDQLTPALEQALFQADGTLQDPVQISLAIKRNDPSALGAALGFIAREEPALAEDRVRIIQALADARVRESIPSLLEIVRRPTERKVREAALAALGGFDEGSLPKELLKVWTSLETGLRRQVLFLLASRPSWARELVASVGGSGVIAKADIPEEVVDRIRLLDDAEVNKLVDRYFGKSVRPSSEDKARQLASLNRLLSGSFKGDLQAGRKTYVERCGVCHKLFGKGGHIGPDLTGYERANLDSMLLSIIDPNAGIREGYVTYQVETRDGRNLVGFIEGREAGQVVLRDVSGQRTTFSLENISQEKALPGSLMPEGLLDGLTEQQLKDFFTYLKAASPPE